MFCFVGVLVVVSNVWYDGCMSTTIDYAWKLTPGFTVHQFADEVRSVVPSFLYGELAYSLVMNAVRGFERQDSYERSFGDLLGNEWNVFLAESRANGVRALFTVFADWDEVVAGQPQLYAKFFKSGEGMLFERRFDLASTIEPLPSVGSEFNYWNGSDSQLDYLSPEEWEARKVLWNKLVPSNKNVSFFGVTVEVMDRMEFAVSYNRESLFAYAQSIVLPSEAYRVTRRRNYLYLKFLQEELGAEKYRELVMSNIMRLDADDFAELPGADDFPELIVKAYDLALVDVAKHPYIY